MVGNQLKVEKMELSHKVPLKYDFLRISDMLPEAMDWGGKCVPRQVEKLLGQNYDKEFEALWKKRHPLGRPMYNRNDAGVCSAERDKPYSFSWQPQVRTPDSEFGQVAYNVCVG